MAARYANHWNAYRTAKDWAELNRLLDETCERQDRDPGEITRSVMIPLYLEETEASRQKVALWGDREWFLVGSDEEIRDRIGRFVDAGADKIIIQVNAASDNTESLGAFAERFF